MKIEKNSYVSMDYTLTLDSGEVVDQSQPENPIEFVCGYNQIVPGLEKQLLGRKKQDSFQAVVPPEEGYGNHHSELVQKIPTENFPKDSELKVGMRFETRTPHGMPVSFVIKEFEGDMALVDLNHPLAGQTLIFDIVIQSVREANQEEIDALNSSSCCGSGESSDCGGGCSCG